MTEIGKGRLVYLRKSPNMDSSRKPEGDRWLADKVREHARGFDWKESSSLALRRGPYIVAAGMDETESPERVLRGSFVDLFDPSLKVQTEIRLSPGARHFLVDLDRHKGPVVASAGQTIQQESNAQRWVGTIEGQAETEAVLLLKVRSEPKSVTVDGNAVKFDYNPAQRLVWLRFPNQPRPQRVDVAF